jgi:predicted RNA binding protein YcfA (HicA-like mRNA interferase family)
MKSFKQWCKELESRGCKISRANGPHILYTHPKLDRPIPVSKGKTVSIGVYKKHLRRLTTVGA